jgi:hypothetical protein
MGTTLALTSIDHCRPFGLDPSAGFEAVQGAYRILTRYREAMMSSVSRPGTSAHDCA